MKCHVLIPIRLAQFQIALVLVSVLPILLLMLLVLLSINPAVLQDLLIRRYSRQGRSSMFQWVRANHLGLVRRSNNRSKLDTSMYRNSNYNKAPIDHTSMHKDHNIRCYLQSIPIH